MPRVAVSFCRRQITPLIAGLALTVLVAPASAVTDVIGAISTSTSWTSANSPYRVTGNVTVNSGVTLTVGAGVVVKFNVHTALLVNGTLDVQGTSGSTVYFTDIRDDTVGGDINGDDPEQPPGAGGWEGIKVDDGASASLTHLNVRYAGNLLVSAMGTYCALVKHGDGGTLTADYLTLSHGGVRDGLCIAESTAAHTIDHSTIQDFPYSGAWLYDASSVTIQNSTFQTNGHYGIYASNGAGPASLTGNTFTGNTRGSLHLQGNASTASVPASNSLAGPIVVSGQSTAAISWLSPFTYQATGFSVGSGSTLTVGPGEVVKFGSHESLDVLSGGALDVQGTSGMGTVYFTSIKNDEVDGNDTGGDGDTSPAGGNWYGIKVDDGASASLTHLNVRYGGGLLVSAMGTYCALVKLGDGGTLTADYLTLSDGGVRDGLCIAESTAAHTIDHSTIQDFPYSGASLYDASNVTIQNSTFQTNGHYGIYASNGAGPASLTGNTFTGNTRGSLHLQGNASTASVPASNSLAGPIAVSGQSTAAISWLSPFTYQATGFSVGSGSTLTVGPGVVVKFGSHESLDVLSGGAFDVQGTAADKVYFTDIRDDTVGGDTNRDTSGTSPAAGGWDGVSIADGASASLTHLNAPYAGKLWVNAFNKSCALVKHGNDGTLSADYLTLSHGGPYEGLCIVNSAAAHTIDHSTIQDFPYFGAWLYNASNVTIQNSTFQNNAYYGIHASDSTGNFSGNTIHNNGRRGISLNGATTTPTITDSTISGNSVGVYCESSANPVIGGSAGSGNDIAGNTTYGVQNMSSGITVNAQYNWWGDATGPYHSTTNSDGLGDTVSDYVDYSNYLSISAFQYTLTTTLDGNGSGTVTSTPSGIDCPGTCSAPFDETASVTLTPAADTASSFTGWSGDADCADGVVSMSVDVGCTATFTLDQHTLTITKTGNGTGTVSSTPAGIDCGMDCTEDYDYGTSVSLTPTADAGYVFGGWSGDLDCHDGELTITDDRACTAKFVIPDHLDLFKRSLPDDPNTSQTYAACLSVTAGDEPEGVPPVIVLDGKSVTLHGGYVVQGKNELQTQPTADLTIDASPVATCPSGDCANADDALILATVDIGAENDACVATCPEDPTHDTCVATCLEGSTGMSSSCASCFGIYDECVLTSCPDSGVCAAPASDDCLACKETSCNPAFLACAGFSLLPF